MRIKPLTSKPASLRAAWSKKKFRTAATLGGAVVAVTAGALLLVSQLAPSSASASSVPPVGRATQSGCPAAVRYLDAYAAPGFTVECPGNALGHQAMTCVDHAPVCPETKIIAIADACPNAYMNEASNSWVETGRSDARLDPYGPCPSG